MPGAAPAGHSEQREPALSLPKGIPLCSWKSGTAIPLKLAGDAGTEGLRSARHDGNVVRLHKNAHRTRKCHCSCSTSPSSNAFKNRARFLASLGMTRRRVWTIRSAPTLGRKLNCSVV